MNTVTTPLLSIDPGSRAIGWALLESGPRYLCSGVCFSPVADADDRVVMAGRTVAQLIAQHNPGAIVVEIPTHVSDHVNATNIILYIRAVGAVELAAAQSGRPVFRWGASNYQEQACKKKHAQQFQQRIGRPPQSYDESDAFAIGFDFLMRHSGCEF